MGGARVSRDSHACIVPPCRARHLRQKAALFLQGLAVKVAVGVQWVDESLAMTFTACKNVTNILRYNTYNVSC